MTGDPSAHIAAMWRTSVPQHPPRIRTDGSEPANARDDFFHRELLMRVASPGPGMAARFDFVIDMR